MNEEYLYWDKVKYQVPKGLKNVSVKTLRSDLEGLVTAGLMETVPINKRLKGYTRSKNFDSRLREIRGK